MTIDGFDIFAFVVFAVLLMVAVIVIVMLGALPGRIAAKRGHPYAAAVNVAAWISLVTLGALWPLALVWAFMPWPSARMTGEVAANEGGRTR